MLLSYSLRVQSVEQNTSFAIFFAWLSSEDPQVPFSAEDQANNEFSKVKITSFLVAFDCSQREVICFCIVSGGILKLENRKGK